MRIRSLRGHTGDLLESLFNGLLVLGLLGCMEVLFLFRAAELDCYCRSRFVRTGCLKGRSRATTLGEPRLILARQQAFVASKAMRRCCIR